MKGKFMEFIQDMLMVILIVSSIIALAIVDKRYNLGLSMSLMNTSMTQPNPTSQTVEQKDVEILALKKRIEVLEKIVTEPSYELDKEIRRL